jgi:hypothetical protein
MAFDPQYRRAYVICELSSTIVGFNYDPTNGVLTPFQTNSTLPPAALAEIQLRKLPYIPQGSSFTVPTAVTTPLSYIPSVKPMGLSHSFNNKPLGRLRAISQSTLQPILPRGWAGFQ